KLQPRPLSESKTKQTSDPHVPRLKQPWHHRGGSLAGLFLEFLEVGLDHGAVLGGQRAGQGADGVGSLLLGELAPHLGDLLDLLRAHLAGAVGRPALRVALRVARLIRAGGILAGLLAARRTAAAVLARVALLLLLLLVLDLLDHLVETDKDILLHLLG